MLPDDVRRQYRHSGMWHTSADRARAQREHDSDIDANNEAQEEEDQRLEEELEELHDNNQFEAACAAALQERKKEERAALVKTKAVPAAAAEVESLFAVNLDWQPMPTVSAPVETKVLLAATAKI